MKFGIKQKILLVLVGMLALTTALAALLASYFTNRQNEQTAFADLKRDAISWRDDLSASTIRLRDVALAALGDAVILNQLAELVTLELNLDEPAEVRASRDAARTLAYAKSVSLNRLHLVLRTGGFSSIAVCTGGQLSHYVSTSKAGMRIRNSAGSPVWVQTSSDANGNFPFQNWPAWAEAVPQFQLDITSRLDRPEVSFDFQAPDRTAIEIVVPVQGVIEDIATDVVAQSTTRYVSELAVSQLTGRPAGAAADPRAAPVAIVVFEKVIDRTTLEQVAAKTGKLPALFSPDGKHRQQLPRPASEQGLWDTQSMLAVAAQGFQQRTVTTPEGSFYQALLGWQFEGEARLVLGLAQSRASTLQNIGQTVAAILMVACVMLLVSTALGMFWVSRYIDPIVALTRAANTIGTQRQAQTDAALTDQSSVEVLRRIAKQAPDEVGDLANAFGIMMTQLRQSFETLEQRVQDRTGELRQQTRYLRTLIDTLPLLVWLKDTESRYLAVNQATADACGRKVEDIVGKSDLELWPRALADAYRADDVEAMTTRQRKTVEEQLADLRGTIWIETYKAPVLDEDGTVLGTVGAARDISERKAVEAAREAALAEAERLATLRSEFLAQMSHELRTPLNAILGYAQILQRDEHLSDRQARGLSIIQESGHHLLALIDDILDLSRIGASKLELHPAVVNLSVFLRAVCDTIRVKADEKSLLFTYEESTDLPDAVRVDEKRLRQVLLNLLGNAVKFTDRGHIILRVKRLPPPPLATRAAHDESDNDRSIARLRFEVEDTGIGMRKEQVERIFLPFEQVGDVKRRQSGAGLGLAISRQLVRLMGGDIQVRSTPGRGSVFHFDLGLPVAESQCDVPGTQRAATGYEGARRRILIVDDIPQSRVMLTDCLESLGFEVVQATNGQEAVDQAIQARPDLIVMDIAMPHVDGLEATRTMRTIPELANVPILIASASATSQDQARSLAAGASTFIPKPVDQHRLVHALGEHLSLEWTYDESKEKHGVLRTKSDDALLIPSPEEMDVLHRLALAGNMRDIRERADDLKASNPRYEPFARRLQTLAERYESEAILNLVERYRAEHARSEQLGHAPPTQQLG